MFPITVKITVIEGFACKTQSKAVIGITVIGITISYTVVPYNGYFGRYKKHVVPITAKITVIGGFACKKTQ